MNSGRTFGDSFTNTWLTFGPADTSCLFLALFAWLVWENRTPIQWVPPSNGSKSLNFFGEFRSGHGRQVHGRNRQGPLQLDPNPAQVSESDMDHLDVIHIACYAYACIYIYISLYISYIYIYCVKKNACAYICAHRHNHEFMYIVRYED